MENLQAQIEEDAINLLQGWMIDFAYTYRCWGRIYDTRKGLGIDIDSVLSNLEIADVLYWMWDNLYINNHFDISEYKEYQNDTLFEMLFTPLKLRVALSDKDESFILCRIEATAHEREKLIKWATEEFESREQIRQNAPNDITVEDLYIRYKHPKFSI